MKLSKLFHTLYATVMALPVLIIPIFALNILHKETEPISIEVKENKEVDFNQYRNDTYAQGSFTASQYNSYVLNDMPLNYGHKYYVSMYLKSSNNGNMWFRIGSTSQPEYLLNLSNVPTTWQFYSYVATLNYVNNGRNASYFMGPQNASGTFDFKDLMIIDFTQMYGAGNEPTIQEFREHYPNEYYEYTVSHKELIPNVLTTYNDTDIGSQFVYALYKPVHDYFNFGDYFGLGGMYDWFQLNIFNGTAPLSFFIVFNVMIYWLFISLFWLLFDILIYVPMVIHKWLDKAEM